MSTNAVWWIGLCAAAMLVVSQRPAAGETWRAAEQPELTKVLEQAPVLQTESLGEPEQIEAATEKAGVGLDGIIDAYENAKANESLKKLDKNGDGKLTSDEYRPQRQGGPGGPGMRGEDFRPGGRGGDPPVEGQRPALQRP